MPPRFGAGPQGGTPVGKVAEAVLALGEEEFTRRMEGIPSAERFRNAGVEHDVVNANDFEFAFIEIEFK